MPVGVVDQQTRREGAVMASEMNGAWEGFPSVAHSLQDFWWDVMHIAKLATAFDDHHGVRQRQEVAHAAQLGEHV